MSSVMKAVGSIFAPKMPKLATPAASVVAMPDPAAPMARLAARREIEKKRERGRAGTIYTDSKASYSNQALGGTS